MCGIFGYVGTGENWDDVFLFLSGLAIATEVRGAHSTGYAALNGKGIFHAKAPLPATRYVTTKAWGRLANRPSEIVIGHCRFATTGRPAVNENNHPHVGGELALVHNGVLSGHRLVAARERLDLRTECDSELILRMIEKHGVRNGAERMFRNVLGGLRRSAAVAVIDAAERRLALFRSYDRPLYVVRIPELGDSIFFASTPEIMADAMELVFKRNLETTSAFSAMPGRLYLVKPNGGAPKIETDDVDKTTRDPWPSSTWLDRYAPPRGTYTQAELGFDPEWKSFECPRCGFRLRYKAGFVTDCPKCGDPREDLKKCHDCSTMIPEFGPCRCDPCADRHRERERTRRNTARKRWDCSLA